MNRSRRLLLESMEQRIVLASVGANDPPATPAWESVIVALNDDVANPRAVAQGLVNARGGQLGHVYEHAIKGFSAQLPEAAIQALRNNPQVKRIEPDLVMQAFAQVTPTGIDRIDAELNLVANINGIDERVDVDIAIIDSGIDADHPDLNVVGGRHFYSVTKGPPRNRGNFQNDNFDDNNGHGSHVAGTAAALDNAIGVVGVAPGARLWAVKVLDSNASGYLSNIIAGIDWVTANAATIEVANMSLGGQGVSTTYHDAIKASVGAGIVYVVASGNDYRDILGGDLQFGTSDDTVPAAYPEVATISAIADTDGRPGSLGGYTNYADVFGPYLDDTFADFSNFSNSNGSYQSWYDTNNKVTSPGLGIDLMLPGVDIYSTYMNGGYAISTGTSMASPHAAGLAALHIAANGRAHNATEVYAIRQALINGGKAWTSPEGLKVPASGPNPDSPDNHIENLGWAGPSGPVDQLPIANIIAPTDGATVSGSVNVVATASDDNAVTQVEFYISGVSIGVDSDGTDGWSASWNTAVYPDASYSLTATATDTANQTGSSTISVTVDNVDDPPSVAITNPAGGATVSGTVSVVANASDDQGVAQVEFFVGGVSIGVDGNGADGWSANWDTTLYTDASYSLTATATDTVNQTASHSVSVNVNNAAPTTMHIGDLDAGSTNQGKTWTATVIMAVHNTAENPVAGATVFGTWSGGASGNASCVTSTQGTCTVVKSNIAKKSGVVTFTVTNISGALTYNSGNNHDPDSDSNGTLIDVNKPLHAASVSYQDHLVGNLLTPSMVRPIVDLAISNWAAAGVAANRLSGLRDADIEIVDLSGSLLGLAYSDWIVLDRDAAGYGWSADPFAAASLRSRGVSLLSAVTHEFGHLLGFDDDQDKDGVMSANLDLGNRPLTAYSQIWVSSGLILDPFDSLGIRGFSHTEHEPSVKASIERVLQIFAAPGKDHLPRAWHAAEGHSSDEGSDQANPFIDDELLALLAQRSTS